LHYELYFFFCLGKKWSCRSGVCWGSFHIGILCGWRWFIKALLKD